MTSARTHNFVVDDDYNIKVIITCTCRVRMMLHVYNYIECMYVCLPQKYIIIIKNLCIDFCMRICWFWREI